MRLVIPKVMVSQHPDHAGKPYWQKETFIPTSAEIEECFRSFSDLGADEYMWDWEGKFVDEAVIERLFHGYSDYFKANSLGKDIFLTFRVPHLNHHTDHRLGRALLTVKTAASLSDTIGFHSPPLIDIIVPLVESATDLLEIHAAYDQLQSLNHRIFKFNRIHHSLGIIPIFESIDTLFRAQDILLGYVAGYQALYSKKPTYLRPFSARSDPALNSGLVPAVVANKVALRGYHEFTAKTKIPTYPIIGPGSLPFRGHFTPARVSEFLQEYPSIHTPVVQGAFRYDWPENLVKTAINKIKHYQPKTPPFIDIHKAHAICDIFSKYYRSSIEKLAPTINEISHFLPPRRERVLHIGLFGYSRETAGVKLPRAIGFTAALYSLGAPPEIIGTGRGLQAVFKAGLLPQLESLYHQLLPDLSMAMSYYNEAAVKELAKTNSAWLDIIEDARIIRDFLRTQTECTIHLPHQRASFRIARRYQHLETKKLTAMIARMAKMRRSLG